MRECVVGMHTFRWPRDSLCAYDESGVERGDVRWRQGEICPSFLFPVTNILGEYLNIRNAEQIFLDAPCN